MERSQWLAEKSKVLNYQCKLRENYLSMCHRCQHLEQTIFQLTMELDRQTNGENGPFNSRTDGQNSNDQSAKTEEEKTLGIGDSDSSWHTPQSPSEKTAPATIEETSLQKAAPNLDHSSNLFKPIQNNLNPVLESVHL
jgi:hypothetical protein